MQRFVTGLVMIVALIGLLYIGGWFFALAILAVYAVAIHEELHALALIHSPVRWAPFVALLAGAPLAYFFSYSTIIPILVILSFAILLQVIRRKNPDLVDVMVSVLPILTLVLPAICFFGILQTTLPLMQLYFLILLFAIAVGSDTCAYFVGTRIGGQKLCPNISPKKTISGAIGGLLGSIVFSFLACWIFSLLSPELPLPPLWGSILVGFFGGIAGQMGDLFASMVKRHCNVKDFGHLFPGHGGMLDRLDSISFVAIIVYSYRIILFS